MPLQRKGMWTFKMMLTLLDYPVMASAALGHDQPAVPSEDVEEREEAEVPLRRKRSAYRRARTEFATPAFEQFQSKSFCWWFLTQAVFESAVRLLVLIGKAPMLIWIFLCSFLQSNVANGLPEQRAKGFRLTHAALTETDGLTLMMQVGTNPALARELLELMSQEDNFIYEA
ncbi:hypothetical protein Tco_0688356 [Tanacetum coccineum]